MSLKVELLEQTFNYIKPYGNLFASNFYENLFKANPETKSLFEDIDPETKKNQLWDSLVLVVENLRQPDTLNDVLQGLGARLFTYGALPEHYPLVRDAFLTTFEQFLGSEWTSEFKQAWLDAYVTFSGMMLDGADCAQKQIAHETHLSESEETIEEQAVVVNNPDNSLAKEVLNIPVSELEETIEEQAVVVDNPDNSLAEEVLNIPVSELEETIEEQVTIVENTENAPEKTTLKTTMPESDNNISQEDFPLDQSEDSLDENALETPLADLSETLKSKTIDPQFPQILRPESQSESTATATAVKSVASEKVYEPETQPRKSNKKFLIGGGVAGAIGLLLLLLL